MNLHNSVTSLGGRELEHDLKADGLRARLFCFETQLTAN